MCSPAWSVPARPSTKQRSDRSRSPLKKSSIRCQEQIIELAGEDFNIDSPKQLSHILFEVLGLTPIKKNQRGYSTNATVLKELSKVHELPSSCSITVNTPR